LGPKRLDLRAMWGLRLDYFGGVRSDERSVVNLALMQASMDFGVEVEGRRVVPGGEVCGWPGWLGGWWRSLEANHSPNQQEMHTRKHGQYKSDCSERERECSD